MPKETVYGFTNIVAPMVGTICLKLVLGERKGRVIHMAEFVVVEIWSVFNVIIGRPSIHAFRIVPSTYH